MKSGKARAEPISFSSNDFDGLVDQAAVIRGELNDIHWEDYREMQRLFMEVFDVPGKTLKHLNDLIYYQGGYPSPKSPPRHEAVGKRFAEGFRLLWLIGRSDDLNQHLREMGLEVVVRDASKLDLPLAHKRMPNFFKKKVEERGTELPAAWKTAVVLNWFVDYCCGLQGTICGKANIIKKEIYPEASAALGDLRKGDFRETVNMRHRLKKIEESKSKLKKEGKAQPFKDFSKQQKRASGLEARLETTKVRIQSFNKGVHIAVKKPLAEDPEA